MITRRQIRIKVMQAAFAVVLGENQANEMFHFWLEEDYIELKKNPVDEDAAAFMRDLFYDSLRHREEYEKLLAPKLENWDLNRLTLTDRVLIMLGVHEMLCFPEIPVKVSINEYIDIAKDYSAEKSAQFVNGMLDAIHLDLVAQGRIKKWGRGLLDPEKTTYFNEPEPATVTEEDEF